MPQEFWVSAFMDSLQIYIAQDLHGGIGVWMMEANGLTGNDSYGNSLSISYSFVLTRWQARKKYKKNLRFRLGAAAAIFFSSFFPFLLSPLSSFLKWLFDNSLPASSVHTRLLFASPLTSLPSAPTPVSCIHFIFPFPLLLTHSIDPLQSQALHWRSRMDLCWGRRRYYRYHWLCTKSKYPKTFLSRGSLLTCVL